MDSEVIIAVISSVGGTGLFGGLLAWARSRKADEADVAKRWGDNWSTFLEIADDRAKKLADQLDAASATAEVLKKDLTDCRGIVADMIRDCEQHGIDTTDYRQRVRNLRTV